MRADLALINGGTARTGEIGANRAGHLDSWAALIPDATDPAAASAVRHEAPVPEGSPVGYPDWASVFGGQHRLTISVGDVRVPGGSHALLQRLLEGRTATVASSRRPPAERAVRPVGPSTREGQPEPSVRAMPLPLAVTGPQSASLDGQRVARAERPRRQPSPLAAALAQAVIEQHAKRAGLVPEVVANVGLVERDRYVEAPARASAPGRPSLAVVAGGRRAEART